MSGIVYGCPRCLNQFQKEGNRPEGCSACSYEEIITLEEALQSIAAEEQFLRDLQFEDEEISNKVLDNLKEDIEEYER